jgi:hypothetical protein
VKIKEKLLSKDGEILPSAFSSLSADDVESDSIIGDLLLSVHLDKDEVKAYSDFFYPAAAATFLPVVDQLGEISARTNGFFALLRYCLVTSRRLAMLDKVGQTELINQEAERIFNNVTSGSRKENISAFLDIMGTGNNHIIKPSDKFEGGYDIQFIGSPSGSESLPSLTIPYKEYGIKSVCVGGKSEDSTYQTEYLEAYASELSQKVVACGEAVMVKLLGASSTAYTSSKNRLVKVIPMTFGFEDINTLFFDHTGLVLSTDFFKNIDNNIALKFNKYFSATVIRTPRQELIRELRSRMSRNSRATPAGETPAPLRPDVEETVVTREGMALSQNVSYSFSVSLPKHIVNYITQAAEGEKPSMLSLHNWIGIWARRHLRAKGSRTIGGKVIRRDAPKFVLSISKAAKATDIRINNGFHIEEGKGDENNIFIAPNGSLKYGLPTSARSEIMDNLVQYEADMEAFLEFCFENGIPANSGSLPSEVIVSHGSDSITKDFKAVLNSSAKYKGKVLYYDWDYNNVITANATDSTSIVATDLVGAAQPDNLTIADYLGFNFAEEGDDPIQKGFVDSMGLMMNAPEDKNGGFADSIGNSNSPTQFIARGGFAYELMRFYTYNLKKERVPSVEELLAKAVEDLDLETLRDDPFLQYNLYSGIISLDLALSTTYTEPEKAGDVLTKLLDSTLRHCSGGVFFRSMVANENEGVSHQDLQEAIRDHNHYFDVRTSIAGDFGRLYNYVGGKMFQLAMEAIAGLDAKALFSIESSVGLSPVEHIEKPNYNAVSSKIMPLAIMFSKYIPDAENIINKAETESETNRPDDSISEGDIKVSGAIEGSQMFPHQVKAHQSLRNRPKFAILDIAPGGGKTSLGLTDIGSMMKELEDLDDKRIKPLLICPDGLIPNWVNDMKIFTGTKWNMIPVNSKVLARWGYEKLEELIKNAPPNSIIVTGFNFLKGKIENITMGTHRVRVSNNLEFMKRFGFDYICIDESHKLKNPKSLIHKTVKQLTTASHVRFLRLATGTLISNRVNDITGQVSLYNGHIFREGEVSKIQVNDVGSSVSINGDDIPVWEVDTPQRARQKLSRYAAVVTLKKKDWAFMLPSPVETFIAVPMVPDPSTPGISDDDVKLGEMHKQLYDAVLQESVEELEELLSKAKARKASIEDDDGDDDDSGSGPTVDMEMGEGDELSALSSADLNPYLQRIERLVTNPMADPLAPDIFGAAGVKHYTSTKAKYIAKRIDLHFNATPKASGGYGKLHEWDMDTLFSEYDLVKFGGKNYVARKLNKDAPEPTLLPASTKGVDPVTDITTWKEEPEGKVLVFCRYTNSVNGVYDALPEHYKASAVKFTGEEADKWANLDAFKNDPDVKILVANEMGIAEGHNLQLASRLIRVESPWAPGDLDQSSSRIFRPDPKAAKDMIANGKPGELYREVIFLDWILCDNTMEVAKQARLIAKIFNKSRFDEAENPLYDEVHDDYDLDEIRMTLSTLRSRASLMEFEEYTSAYARLNYIQREEFHEMRVTQDFTMKDLEAQDEVAGSAKVQTPYVSNQVPEDPDKIGLVSLRNLLRTEGYEKYSEDPSLLQGLPVVTDLGKGRIAKVKIRFEKRVVYGDDGKPLRTRGGMLQKEFVTDAQGNKVVDKDNPLSSFIIKSAETNDVLPSFSDTGVVFIPTNLGIEQAKKEFHVNNLNTTKTEERRAAKAKMKLQQQEEYDVKREEAALQNEEDKKLLVESRRRKKLKKEAEARAVAGETAKKRKKNLQKGKPINQGVKRVSKVPDIMSGPEEYFSIRLHPAYFHGYLTLEVESDSDNLESLSKFKFKESGPYVYCTVNRYTRYEKILDYIEDNFDISNQSAARLANIQEAFEAGGKEVYKLELAPSSSMPYFFATRKRKVQNRKEIRPYPIIMPNELQIVVDLATCPIIKQHIGKSIPGAVTKWRLSEGHKFFFAKSKAELRMKIKELKSAGFVIENEDDMRSEITNIKFRASSGKK